MYRTEDLSIYLALVSSFFRSLVGKHCKLILSALDLRAQVVLSVALRDVLDQGAVVRQKVRRDVDSLRVPNLAVLQAVLLGVESGQEAQLRPDAEVRDDDVEGLVEQLVLAYLRHQVVPNALLRCHRT